jgi:hypothetical protein
LAFTSIVSGRNSSFGSEAICQADGDLRFGSDSEVRVRLGSRTAQSGLPDYPSSRHRAGRPAMSEMCQNRKSPLLLSIVIPCAWQTVTFHYQNNRADQSPSSCINSATCFDQRSGWTIVRWRKLRRCCSTICKNRWYHCVMSASGLRNGSTNVALTFRSLSLGFTSKGRRILPRVRRSSFGKLRFENPGTD